MAFGSLNNDLTIANGFITNISKMSTAMESLQRLKIIGLKNDDISKLQKYIELIETGETHVSAFQNTMSDASNAAKQQSLSFSKLYQSYKDGTVSAKEYNDAINTVSQAQKAATATSKALSVGLNLVTNIAITATITELLKLFQYLTTFEERSAQAAEELARSLDEAKSAYKSETESLQTILNKYNELILSTDNINTIKGDLSRLQDEIIQKYGDEANAIDIVNGKYSEQIEKIRTLATEYAEQYLSENQVEIREARKALSQTHELGDNNSRYIGGFGKDYIVNSNSAIEIKAVGFGDWDVETRQVWENIDGIVRLTHDNLLGDQIAITGSLEEQYNTLISMRDAFGNIKNYNEDRYKQLNDEAKKRKELLDTFKETDILATEAERKVADSRIPTETLSEFNSLIDKAKELNQTIQGDGTVTERYAASQELESLKNEIYQVAGANTTLKNEADTVFAAFETGASNAITSTADLEKEFYESLDDMQNGSLKNIELIENAMQTLSNGKYVPWKDFFDIKKLDTDDVLSIPTKIGNELNMDAKELQQLKDAYINPIIESLQKENQSIQDQIESTNGIVNGLKDQLKYERLILDAQIAQGANSASEDTLIRKQKQKVQEIRDKIDKTDKIKDYGDQIDRNNLLIEMWNTHLGDTIDKTEMLKNRQEAADNYAKAMTSKINSIIDSHESEKDVLEKEKEVLNEQLDALEKQQKAIEDIIDDYKSVVDMVGDVTDKEIDLLKKQQEAEENAVQAKIDALKEAREQQEEENTLTEKQIELQEKLRDLEKARQTKVRTYSSERGWHFDVDKEVVANAQTAVDDAQADYDKAVDDKAYNDQISALEKEKDLISKNFEEQIKAYEDYYDEWKSILDEQTEAENDQIAQQILGAEWREKIKDKDTDVLDNFKSNFEGYNTQLNNLTNTEIANLKLSIKAKEDEIDAKEKQIQSWKDYKTQVENSINSIKSKYEDYVDLLDHVVLDEKSSYDDREKALAAFIDTYQGYVDEILNIQSQLSDDNVVLNIDTNIPEIKEQIATLIENYREGVEAMQRYIKESLTGYGVVNSEWDAKLAKAANALRGYSNGGTVDYTGIAAVHGSKKSSEVIFNAAQSKQLYDMVMKGEFADLAAARAAEGFTSVLKSIESARTFNKNINNTNNSNTSSIVIQHMDINGVQNPAQFANEFNKNMEQYLRNVYAESLVN